MINWLKHLFTPKASTPADIQSRIVKLRGKIQDTYGLSGLQYTDMVAWPVEHLHTLHENLAFLKWLEHELKTGREFDAILDEGYDWREVMTKYGESPVETIMRNRSEGESK